MTADKTILKIVRQCRQCREDVGRHRRQRARVRIVVVDMVHELTRIVVNDSETVYGLTLDTRICLIASATAGVNRSPSRAPARAARILVASVWTAALIAAAIGCHHPYRQAALELARRSA